ncbi:MAG: CRISPR-associated protein Cas4 [Bacteroidota bacterium]|nr:CRISPR-associated protein Cas4 [Candidatus Kapabacteria bacterium]MCX7937763.1 CRISPR-associated protein Cas4 [Chlorobiota bacterium]MDW8075951.1 CRISPR-associated protein Cas4 [Bacteroidota bacterium]
MYSEEDFLPINLLQHYVFCPRQCGLIAVECLWRENALTIGGKLLHEHVDRADTEWSGDVERISGLRIHSYRYGLTGKCDLVERRHTPHGIVVTPIEYKAGEPKPDLSDSIQLCAQALCLEEMMHCTIPQGMFFYGKIRRRVALELTDELRQRTIETITAVRQMVDSFTVPPAEYAPKCRSCSLVDLCQPKAANRQRVQSYLCSLFHSVEETP